MEISSVKHTIKLASLESSGCPYCSQWLEGDSLDRSINHLLQEHAATLLHVGSESYRADGTNVSQIIAILGSDTVPAERAPSRFNIHYTPPEGSENPE